MIWSEKYNPETRTQHRVTQNCTSVPSYQHTIQFPKAITDKKII